MENLTKEIVMSIPNIVSKGGILGSAFFRSGLHSVKHLCFFICEWGLGLSSERGFMLGGRFPRVTLEDSSQIRFSGELNVIRCLDNIIPVEGCKDSIEGDGDFGFRR
jgi:hypothetical protein